MPIFRCDSCRSIENTAACRYWTRLMMEPKPPMLCSACDPMIGKWHGIFERRQDETLIELSDGFLYHPEEVKQLAERPCQQGASPGCRCLTCSAKVKSGPRTLP